MDGAKQRGAINLSTSRVSNANESRSKMKPELMKSKAEKESAMEPHTYRKFSVLMKISGL